MQPPDSPSSWWSRLSLLPFLLPSVVIFPLLDLVMGTWWGIAGVSAYVLVVGAHLQRAHRSGRRARGRLRGRHGPHAPTPDGRGAEGRPGPARTRRGPRWVVDLPIDSPEDRRRTRELLGDLLAALGDRVEHLSVDPVGSRTDLEDVEVRASQELQQLVPRRSRVTEPALDHRDPRHVRLFLDWCLASDCADVRVVGGSSVVDIADGTSAVLRLRAEDVHLVAGLASAAHLDLPAAPS